MISFQPLLAHSLRSGTPSLLLHSSFTPPLLLRSFSHHTQALSWRVALLREYRAFFGISGQGGAGGRNSIPRGGPGSNGLHYPSTPVVSPFGHADSGTTSSSRSVGSSGGSSKSDLDSGSDTDSFRSDSSKNSESRESSSPTGVDLSSLHNRPPVLPRSSSTSSSLASEAVSATSSSDTIAEEINAAGPFVHVTTVNWATPAGIPASGEVTKVAHRAMLAKIDQTSGSHHGKREWLVVDVALTEVRVQAYLFK